MALVVQHQDSVRKSALDYGLFYYRYVGGKYIFCTPEVSNFNSFIYSHSV